MMQAKIPPQAVRIWFHPPKLWRATQHMKPAEKAAFIDNVYRLAERRDVAALEKYDFIRIGPYRDVRWR